jgi:hypothetical protein
MEIFSKLLLDIGLILALMLSTTIIDFTLATLFRGIFRLQSLNFGIFFSKSSTYIVSPFLILVLVTLSSFLLIVSYFCSTLFLNWLYQFI